jgi:hypothetical protein
MFDTVLYQHDLGLTAPWIVTEVNLDVESAQIHVHVEHADGFLWLCPQCQKDLACYDHSPNRTWRHLNTCQFQTLVHTRPPRVECPEHGVVQVKVPWAKPHGRFTDHMEQFIFDVIKARQTVKRACALVGITWDQAWHVLERTQTQGLPQKDAAEFAGIGVDEKAFRKGHRYLALMKRRATSCLRHGTATLRIPAAGRKTSVDMTTFLDTLHEAKRTGQNQSWVAGKLGVRPAAVSQRMAALRKKRVAVPDLVKGRCAKNVDIDAASLEDLGYGDE